MSVNISGNRVILSQSPWIGWVGTPREDSPVVFGAIQTGPQDGGDGR